jgi:hypothetical protein
MSEHVPDIGDLFTEVTTFTSRKWQWLPFPWKRKHVIAWEHHYRVDAWLRRRPPRPAPRTEQERVTREVMRELLAEGRIEPPRGAGPDKVPLDFCLRHEAEYVSGTGVDGTIARVSDVTVTGRVSWPPEILDEHRRHAISLAGEPLT